MIIEQRNREDRKDLKVPTIQAKFEHGVLKLSIPKQEQEKLPEKKTILIEG